MKFLLDENLSPRLVPLIRAKGCEAAHIAHRGRAGMSDPELWRYAFDQDAVVATINAGDFLTLAAGTDLHPGLLVVRVSGLSMDGQWAHLEPAIDHALAEAALGGDLVNRVIEVFGIGRIDIYDLPRTAES